MALKVKTNVCWNTEFWLKMEELVRLFMKIIIVTNNLDISQKSNEKVVIIVKNVLKLKYIKRLKSAPKMKVIKIICME